MVSGREHKRSVRCASRKLYRNRARCCQRLQYGTCSLPGYFQSGLKCNHYLSKSGGERWNGESELQFFGCLRQNAYAKRPDRKDHSKVCVKNCFRRTELCYTCYITRRLYSEG